MPHAIPFFSVSRRRLAAALVLASLTACGSLGGGPRQIHISEAQLLSRIATQFPVKQRQLGLFDVVLEQPRLRLRPEENRVVTELSYSVAAALAVVPPVKGQLEMSYGLRYEPGDNTLRLAEVRVERLGVDGLSAVQAAQIKKIGALMADDLLKDAVVYRVKPEDLQTLTGHGYRPGEIRVVSGGLRLALEPLTR